MSLQSFVAASVPLNFEHKQIALMQSLQALIPVSLSRNSRCQRFCAMAVGQRYIVAAQGDGEAADVDQMPRYRFDGYDCVTFVTTVLAFVHSHDWGSFIKVYDQLSHTGRGGPYAQRHHFFSLDWLPQARKNQWLRDVTATLAAQHDCLSISIAETQIDKAAWLRAKNIHTIRLRDCHDAAMRQRCLQQLHQRSHEYRPQQARLPYIALSSLQQLTQQQWQSFVASLPASCIMTLVRANYSQDKLAATFFLVSHVGILLREHAHCFLYHAALKKHVVRVSAYEYIQHCRPSHVLGFNFHAVV